MKTEQTLQIDKNNRLNPGKNIITGFKQIVVPYDFSERALKALQYAVALAELSKAKITLLNVVELPVTAPSIGIPIVSFPYEGLVESTSDQLKKIAKGYIPAEIESNVEVLAGQPFREIAAAAKRLSADVIVVTTHGYTGMKHVIMGSTAERVVRYAPCPVLVVRVQDLDFEMTPEKRAA